ncbi:hypothetical protein ERO13_A08G073500v2 [Gossypium hirsutum]|nr:hypothetical protein ERO13_A08G073500v2 [Gossypium hirsutum]
MELYGQNPARNGSFSGHQLEWIPAGPETGGLEESMWQLSLRGTESYPERPGVPDCVYYMRTGFCGYGNRCRYNHPRNRAAVEAAVRATGEYPERPGEPACQAPVSPALSPGAQPAVGATSLYGLTQLSSSAPSLAGPYSSLPSSTGPSSSNQKEQTFPERPGEPECQYYLRTGNCKFGSSCRYHHPRDKVVQQTNCILSPMGLPLRPGVQPCAFYLQNGNCKFGSTCKFDHPIGTMRYSPSASSLIDIPVAPYPFGSLLATLAPSSSSSELRPEMISRSKDSYLSRISSSASTASSSVGLIFSQTGSVHFSDLQLSSQSLSSSRSTIQGAEVHSN